MHWWVTRKGGDLAAAGGAYCHGLADFRLRAPGLGDVGQVMNQIPEMQRGTAAAPRRSGEEGEASGTWAAVAVVALSGIACWFWLASAMGTATPPRPAAAGAIAELAQVEPQDINGALSTMNGSPGALAQFGQRENRCPLPLAWVSVAGAPGQPGTIRLKSGSYFSPIFPLGDAPVRIAIPYPAPYEAGNGMLVAMHTGGGAVIGLVPAWQVPADNSTATRQVRWPVTSRCR